MGYTPNRFTQLDFFLICLFLIDKFEKNVKFMVFSNFSMFSGRIYFSYLLIKRPLNPLKFYKINFLNGWVTLEIRWCLVSAKEKNSRNSRKNDEFYNVAPQIFFCEHGDRYQCVALSELVWMQCVDFFICDWLKRYRQNTTENLPIWVSWKNEEF